MLEYIKQQLQEMNPAPQEDAVQEQLMDEAVLDCAHLFQEFDDLTMNGTITNGPRQFANVDIPLADDIEITSVELNLLDNRVVDVPMDATVQESIGAGLMKTFEDFYQEALESNVPRGRETQGVFEDRCYRIAEAEFQKYRDYIIQEGLFGFDKIPITDPRVPTTAQLNCGTRKGNAYVVFLNVYFQVDKKNRITKKQLETIQDFQSRAAQAYLSSELQKIVFEKWGGMCNCDSVENIWDHVSPCELLVPVDPADQYCTVIVFEFAEFDVKKSLVYTVTIPKGNKRGEAPEKGLTGDLKEIGQNKIESMHAITKRTGNKIAQEAAEWKPRELNRFGSEYYQEGIDFGDADAPPSADANASSVSFGNGDAAPDANAGGADAAAAPAEGDANAEPKEVAVANNVSDQIAEKVADETQNDANETEGLSVDGVDDATADADVSDLDNSDAPTEEEVNADLGDVDENSTDEADATSDVDVDNMTPEELKAAAADKIEKMTFQQIKDFLNNGEGTTSDAAPEGDEGVQEAFFLTRGNIGKELDIHLRRTLGILNDSEMEIGVLCSKFRKQGKRLNHVVHKASKMKDVFNEGEIKQLLKLNALLSDLMAMMRTDLDPQGVQAVKRLIKAFVQQATGVAKLVEKKQPEKPVQEGFSGKTSYGDEIDRQIARIEPREKKLADEIAGKADPERLRTIRIHLVTLYEQLIEMIDHASHDTSLDKAGMDELTDLNNTTIEKYVRMVHDLDKPSYKMIAYQYALVAQFNWKEMRKFINEPGKHSDFLTEWLYQKAKGTSGDVKVDNLPKFEGFKEIAQFIRGEITYDKAYRACAKVEFAEFITESILNIANDIMNGKSKSVQEAATSGSVDIELPAEHKKFLDSGEYKKYQNVVVADEVGMVKIQKFLSYDEIRTEYTKLQRKHLSVTSPHGWSVDNMIPVAKASSADPEDVNERGFIDYIVLAPDKKGGKPSVYYVLDMKTAEGSPALFNFARDLSFFKKMVEYWKDKSVQEAYYPPNPDKFNSHYSEIESMLGRSLPDGYKRIIQYDIQNIGIKGADGWFQGCEWEINTSSLKDRDKYDYDGHPGSEFIPLANNGRGDEVLMGNTSKTDTRIFTYIHDVKGGLKQIAANGNEFEDLLYTIHESDAKYDTTKIDFFGTERPVRIGRGVPLKDTFIAIDFANNCGKLLDDSVRKQIKDIMEKCKGDFTDEELKSADWKHPEKHLKPLYIYINDHTPVPGRVDSRYNYKIMLDCDWDFDPEHGLAIMFDENMKLKAVGQAGDYL